MRRYGQVRIAIGSSQYRRTAENPFSFFERMRTIRMVVAAHPGWSRRIQIRTLPDYPGNDEKWAKQLARRFDSTHTVVGSANSLVRRLSKKAGFEIDPAPLFRRMSWQGKTIRRLVRAGKKWDARVPLALKGWMKEKGAKIIRET